MSGDLVDTTEMYLKAIYELEEEGILPLRARLVERLGQSKPTVSETVARMERDGLLTIVGTRKIELSERGRAYATSVMRKHRLAELLLVHTLGVPWAEIHNEACRWEHVISDAVGKKIAELEPGTCDPFGNVIPEEGALGPGSAVAAESGLVRLVDQIARFTENSRIDPVWECTLVRIGEPAQTDEAFLRECEQAGIQPGVKIRVYWVDDVTIEGPYGAIQPSLWALGHLMVPAAEA